MKATVSWSPPGVIPGPGNTKLVEKFASHKKARLVAAKVSKEVTEGFLKTAFVDREDGVREWYVGGLFHAIRGTDGTMIDLLASVLKGGRFQPLDKRGKAAFRIL